MDTLINFEVFSNTQATELTEAFRGICDFDAHEDESYEGYELTPSVCMTGSIDGDLRSFTQEVREHFELEEFDVIVEELPQVVIIKIHPFFARGRKLTINEWCSLLDWNQLGRLIAQCGLAKSISGDYTWDNYEVEPNPSHEWEVKYGFVHAGLEGQALEQSATIQTKSLREAEVVKIALEQITREEASLLSCFHITTKGTQPSWLQKRSLFFFGIN